MPRRSSKKELPRKARFAGWLRGRFDSSSGPVRGARRLLFEYLEPRQLLSVAQPNGPELQVNTYTTGGQDRSKVASDAAGDYVIVWQGNYEDGSGYGVFAQRYSAAGAAEGSEFRVNTYTRGGQSAPSVAMDSTGDFVVAWASYGEDGSNYGIYAQRYNSSGAALGSEFQVNTYTTGPQDVPAVAMDSAGDFVIAWQSFQDGGGGDQGGNGVYAQRYNAGGVAQGSEFRVNTYTTGGQIASSVAMDSAGDFVIAWQSGYEDGSGYGVYAQRYNSSGVAQGSEFRVNTYTTDNEGGPAVAMDSAGDFVIAWNSPADGSDYGVYAQRYNSSGVAQGSEFRVNTYTTGSQDAPTVAMDSTGDFVVAWQSGGQDGSGYGVYAQRYNSSGVTQGSEFRVNTYTTGDQGSAAAAMDSAGDFVIAWQSGDPSGPTQDGSSFGVFAQRYVVPSALAAGNEFQVNTYTTGGQDRPKVASDAAGDYVIVWQGNYEDGSGYGVFAQRYSAAGVAEGSEFRVNTYTRGGQSAPSVAMDSTGDFVVAWASYGEDGSNYGIYAQRYNSSGAALGSEFQVNTYTTGPQDVPAVAMDSAGDFVIAWQSFQDGGGGDQGGNGVYAQRYNAGGVAQGSEFRVNTYTTGGQIASSVAMDSAGDFVIAWQSGYEDGSGYGVYAQRYNSSGVAQGSEFRVNTYTTDNEGGPSVAMDSAGDFVIAWNSPADGSDYGVYAQRYNSSGVAQGSEFRVNTYTTGTQEAPTVGMDSTGDFVVAWQSGGQDGSGYGVYAQRYNSSGVTQGSEFRVNTYTTGDQGSAAAAMDSAGDFVIAWQSGDPSGPTQDGSSFGVFAQRFSTTLTITGSANDNVIIAFSDATDFTVTINGGTPAAYNTADIYKLVYNGPVGAFSKVVFSDPVTTDDYMATQTFSSTTLLRSGGVNFEFDGNHVANLYIYVSDPSSTATVTVAVGTGSNFYVDAASGGYSYIADPIAGIYSELSGFPGKTATGSAASTYAYIYSTSHASVVGDPAGSSITVGGVTSTLSNFPQVYTVGSTDGTDTVTLHTQGGSFVGQPSFSYVSGTFNGGPFLVGALFAANVTAQATHATDPAFFYSYAADTFSGAQGTSTLTGSATGFASFSTFVSQAMGFQAMTVLESGAGTDVANLTSPGDGTFTETATASTLVVGGVTVITVNTFFNNSGTLVAVPSTVNITGNANGSDTANLYDAAGSNVLVAQGNQATLTTSVNTVAVTQFGKVNAFQTVGTDDTVHQGAIDFALQTIGNWTSV